ncbi:uncharacterized protein (TIGR02300 family) [Sphingomonas yantingensis]|uniref:Uncharacterized protein (TIGR02300 family) n=2 Tax=Sphingomonas yantingensis TaxID=1241761 RepID=A0A7W9AN29_9SPHN|nr:uncharacterized protein (TIGR02300 family) [Sphingomonas yantingensis]
MHYGKARATSRALLKARNHPIRKAIRGMVKPEWGTKRSCPKCGTRFYDLQKDEPVTCINCGYAWEPEPILKSKQPLPFEAVKADKDKDKEADSDLGDDLDIDTEDDDTPADDDVDLGGDDDLGVEAPSDDDEN